MKVVLCNPPYLKNYSRQSRSPCVAKSGTIYYSYYLAYAAAALEKNGHNVQLIDCVVEELNHQSSIDKVLLFEPDLVVVDTSTPSIKNDLEFCRNLKRNSQNLKVIITGTFPSKADNYLKDLLHNDPLNIDAWCYGEYEITLVDFCNFESLNFDKAPRGMGILNADGEIEKGENTILPDNDFLDGLPFVSEIYKKHYGEKVIKKHFYASIRWPYLHILTSRGCPYKCSFCNIPSIGSYRVRSIDNVIAELIYIEKNMPYIKEVFFEDDTFPINKKRVLEFCEKYNSNNLKLTWSCNGRVNTDLEVLKAMKAANCRLICVGFESPSSESLEGILKKTTLESQKKFMANANEAKIKINGCFILGLHGDNQDSIKKTIEYSKELLPNTAQFYPHMLYPGTGSFKWAKENNLILHTDWEKWLTKEGYHSTPLIQNNITPEQLLSLCDEARSTFYLNPKYLIKMVIQSLKDFSEFQRILIAGKTFFPILLKSLTKR